MSGAGPGARDRSPDSYAHYANADVAAGFDALRFGGPIGELLAETQERVLADFLAPLEGLRVLDVGTGSGRPRRASARRSTPATRTGCRSAIDRSTPPSRGSRSC